MDRLRQDLVAQRNKDGVFMAKERYDEMMENEVSNAAAVKEAETTLMNKTKELEETMATLGTAATRHYCCGPWTDKKLLLFVVVVVCLCLLFVFVCLFLVVFDWVRHHARRIESNARRVGVDPRNIDRYRAGVG